MLFKDMLRKYMHYALWFMLILLLYSASVQYVDKAKALEPYINEQRPQQKTWIRDPQANPFPEKLWYPSQYKELKVPYHRQALPFQHFNPRPSEHLNIAQIKEEARNKYANRRRGFQEYCKHIRETEDTRSDLYVRTHEFPDRERNMRHSWDHRFFGCSKPKSGITSWKSHYLSILKYYDYPVNCSEIRCDHVQSEFFHLPDRSLRWSYFANDTLSFFFSRHPFSHVVSAYNYMFMAIKQEMVYMEENYKDEIEEITRLRSMKNLKTRSVPPSILLKHIFTQFKEDSGYKHMDPHFWPGWSYCSVCAVDYDIIGDMATFEEDTQYIFEKLGMADALEHPAHENSAGAKKTTIKEFFSQLTKAEIIELYHFYKHDFLLGGVNNTLREYLDMASDSSLDN